MLVEPKPSWQNIQCSEVAYLQTSGGQMIKSHSYDGRMHLTGLLLGFTYFLTLAGPSSVW